MLWAAKASVKTQSNQIWFRTKFLVKIALEVIVLEFNKAVLIGLDILVSVYHVFIG